MDLEEIPFDLRSLCTDVTTMMQVKAEKKGILFKLVYDPSTLSLFQGDPVRLRQVLVNLCGNAVKFTEIGNVTLKVSVDDMGEGDHLVHISIRDTGIGISPDKMNSIFNKFEQGDASTTRKFGGTGLGLAISQRIIRMMNSDIGVVSTPGMGAEFMFSLRLRQPVGVPSAVMPERTLQKRIQFREARVLLAEDNVVNQEIMSVMLEHYAINVTIVPDGKSAVDMLQRKIFDMVLMDCHMPEMDGYEAARFIRELSQFEDLPIIALTANAMKGDREKCLAAGMNDYLSKPVDVAALEMVLLKWMPSKKHISDAL